MGGPSVKYGGSSTNYGGWSSTNQGGAISQVWGGVINQLWGGHQPSMGGSSTNYGGPSAKYGGGYFPTSMYRKSKWSAKYGGGHQPTMGGPSAKYGGGHQPTMGGGASAKYGGGGIFPPVCTGSQNPQNYFSNTYVLPSVNRTAGPIIYFCRSNFLMSCCTQKPIISRCRNGRKLLSESLTMS